MSEQKVEVAPEPTKATEAKVEPVKAETPPPAPVVPEKYDIKLPDGSPVDPARIAEISSKAKEMKLTNDQAQALLTGEHEALSSFTAKQMEQAKSKRAEWVETAKSDKEIGGENFSKNVELAKRVTQRFGTDEFKNWLNETGMGDNPELMRVFVKIGNAMSEDQLVMPGTQAGGKRSMEDIFYGGTKAGASA